MSATDGGEANGSGGQANGSGGQGGGFVIDVGGRAPDAAAVCESASVEATVTPVVLAVAFDVSGSMGEGDKPWHDKALKWDPIVEAAKSFFADPASRGIQASLTFFPERGGDAVRCDAGAYATPDVPLTDLPSAKFGDAIDSVEAEPAWRGGTPTRYVVQGTIAYVRERQAADPESTYAIVLVTDGYPEGCGATNAIAGIAGEIEAVADTVPTYVVGVANPTLDGDGNPIPGVPENVAGLQALAVAGRTDEVFLIDTGDAEQTAADFRAAIDAIRRNAISCSVSIPPAPPGRVFEKEKVRVRYRSGAARTELDYDPTCVAANAWHYDDATNPREIVLCESTCGIVQADMRAELGVEFACEEQIIIR